MRRFLIAFGSATFLLAGPAMTGPLEMVSAAARDAQAAETASMPLPLKVVKTQVLNSKGEVVQLRGVNAACLEWTSDGEGHILDTVKTAIRDWKVNHIRLPMAQDRWFGKGPEQKDQGAAYRALVKQVVDLCASQGCYIILDLHWSDAGEWGKQIGQHVMPDANSVPFWTEVATAYKNHPAVLFDLYNEPHQVSWDIWLKGGKVSERDRRTGQKEYLAVGMQALLDAVCATGAENVVVVGGLDWSYDLAGILAGRQLRDPKGNGVIYANHAYPFKGDTVEQWIAKMETATKTLPVIVSEFGSETRGRPGVSGEQWVRQVLQALEGHQWAWTAWDLHPAAGPRLVSNWKYTPTPHFGRWVKEALLGTLPPYTPPSPRTASPVTSPRRTEPRRSGFSKDTRMSAPCDIRGRSSTTRPRTASPSSAAASTCGRPATPSIISGKKRPATWR